MTIEGKAAMLWKMANVGGIPQVVSLAQRLQLKRVEIKIANGINTDLNGTCASLQDQALLVKALKDAGIEVWGWHYIMLGHWFDKATSTWHEYGTPEDEARVAALRLSALNLDGYVMDCEAECKAPDARQRATRFATTWNQVKPSMIKTVALCSYRFPGYHHELPWDVFCSISDVHMPQLYWMPGKVADEYLLCVNELKAIKDMPIYPVGRAYIGDGHSGYDLNGKELIAGEITQFLNLAVNTYHTPTVSFWALDFLMIHKDGASRADAIAAFNYPVSTPVPQPAPVQKSVDQRVADLEAAMIQVKARLGI